MSCLLTDAVTAVAARFEEDRISLGQTPISFEQVSSNEAFLCVAGDDAHGMAAE